MNLLLTHLPHLALAVLTVVLFVWMERSDRHAQAAPAGGKVEGQDTGPRGGTGRGLPDRLGRGRPAPAPAPRPTDVRSPSDG